MRDWIGEGKFTGHGILWSSGREMRIAGMGNSEMVLMGSSLNIETGHNGTIGW